jgi:hypothetical protein
MHTPTTNNDSTAPRREPVEYRWLGPEKLAEARALKARSRELRARLEAELTEGQKRLAFELETAEDDEWGMIRFAQMNAMVERLSEHFPGIGPALKLVAGHCAWGSHIDMHCCGMTDHGVGL